MSTVEQESKQLRQELRLTDLVLTQIMYVVGLSWVGTAAKLGSAQIPFWLGAMAVFYVPQAIVVIYLSRRFPLEGGLYQWSKLGLNQGIAFLVGWNLWVYAIVQLGTEGLQVANAVIYAIGPRAEFLSGNFAFTVAQRTAELGIRMALGASASDVLRLVVGQGMRPVIIGLAVGLLAALGLARVLHGFLFGVAQTDPGTYVTVTVVLSCAAMLACYLPARRAARVDPMTALRSE